VRPLDAEADGAEWDEAALLVLSIDPIREPARAHRVWESHLARAKWPAKARMRPSSLCWPEVLNFTASHRCDPGEGPPRKAEDTFLAQRPIETQVTKQRTTRRMISYVVFGDAPLLREIIEVSVNDLSYVIVTSRGDDRGPARPFLVIAFSVCGHILCRYMVPGRLLEVPRFDL
jgi:hypothetical protein